MSLVEAFTVVFDVIGANTEMNIETKSELISIMEMISSLYQKHPIISEFNMEDCISLIEDVKRVSKLTGKKPTTEEIGEMLVHICRARGFIQ